MKKSLRKIQSISLPPAMRRDVLQVAKLENRSTSEIFREALRAYLQERSLKLSRIRKTAKEGAKQEDEEGMWRRLNIDQFFKEEDPRDAAYDNI